MKDKKTDKIFSYVTKSEKKSIEKAAEKARMPISRFVATSTLRNAQDVLQC